LLRVGAFFTQAESDNEILLGKGKVWGH
jgi:hypothetical protein